MEPAPGPEKDELTLGGGRMVYTLDVLSTYEPYTQAASSSTVHFLRTKRGEKIAAVWVKCSQGVPVSAELAQEPMVLLHCHGNATDAGLMMALYYEMARRFHVEVVGVEYSGYGASSGRPSVSNANADVEAVYNFLIRSGVAPERIVAYGQSVGSGPVLELASKSKLGGVILHSPLLSGIKVIDPEPERCCRPSCVYCCFDFFPNDRRMQSVSCPTFVLHGRRDDVIPFYHGERLAKQAPKEHQWPGYFPDFAGHNDLVEVNCNSYYAEVAQFLNFAAQHRLEAEGKAVPASCPAQVEMSELHIPMSATMIAEVAVGPEDGRYEQMRQGNLA